VVRVGPVDRRDVRAIVALLESAGTRWSAATTGSATAAGYELASNTAVMAIGGFLGRDSVPTAARFEADVRAGLVRYYVVDGLTPGRGTAAAEIARWVEHHFRGRSIDHRRVYDLTPSRRPVG
jgi:hypothetical protein